MIKSPIHTNFKKFDFKNVDTEGFETLKTISEANNFNEWMYQTIRPFCKGVILEVGSGIGNISKFFIESKSDIYLSDVRNAYCDYLKSSFQLDDSHLIRGLDLVDPLFEKRFEKYFDHFDTIFALNVIEHIDLDSVAIRNCKRLLRSGGTLVILVPAFNVLYNKFDEDLGHYRRYTIGSLTSLFQSSGLDVIKTSYFNVAGILGWFVSGQLQKNKSIPKNQMNLYDRMVPFFKILDRIFFNSAGLSAIAIGKK